MYVDELFSGINVHRSLELYMFLVYLHKNSFGDYSPVFQLLSLQIVIIHPYNFGTWSVQ